MIFDMLVIGSEREGIERALAAARNSLCVGVVEDFENVTSSASFLLQRQALDRLLNLGQNSQRIPGRSSLEADSHPSLQTEAGTERSTDLPSLTMSAWQAEVARLKHRQILADRSEMDDLGIERISGQPKFLSASTIRVTNSGEVRDISGSEFVIACGTKTRPQAAFPCDGRFVFDVESVLGMPERPRSMIVVGAGETGLSTAITFAKLGVDVTVVDEHVNLLEVCSLFDGSLDAIQSLQIAFRLGDAVIGTESRPDLQAAVRMTSGRVLTADAIVVCAGREGRTDGLNLEAVGVGLDEHGRIWCDNSGRTWSPHIFAVGQVPAIPISRPNLVQTLVA